MSLVLSNNTIACGNCSYCKAKTSLYKQNNIVKYTNNIEYYLQWGVHESWQIMHNVIILLKSNRALNGHDNYARCIMHKRILLEPLIYCSLLIEPLFPLSIDFLSVCVHSYALKTKNSFNWLDFSKILHFRTLNLTFHSVTYLCHN